MSIRGKEKSDLQAPRTQARGWDFKDECMASGNSLSLNVELRELKLEGNELFSRSGLGAWGNELFRGLSLWVVDWSFINIRGPIFPEV